MADRGEQRGAHPVALGQRLGLGGLGPQPVPVQRGRGLGGEAVQQPGRDRPGLRADDEDQARPRLDADRLTASAGAVPLTATLTHCAPTRSTSSARPPRVLVR